ncbi:Multidrug resistance protein MdtH [Phycisphaerae bacterium RAS2]|nr:Multidrug resistance protein MdtH [Phycisphaerae bacterium RAS2]
MMTTAPAAAEQPPATEPRTRFPFRFWLLNTIEAGERLAFYLVWPILMIYIAQADDPGGLHRSQDDKGTLIFWFSLVQIILPIISGGYADRYGFKLSLIISMLISTSGYAVMAMEHSFRAAFWGMMLVGVGAAFFKPAIQGSLSHLLTRQQSSLGWGIFYWVVNIGAMVGHWLSPLVLLNPTTANTYRNLFLIAAGCCLFNMIALLLVFRDIPSGAAKDTHPLRVLWLTVKNIIDPRLLAWLLIMSCFWMMMYQLWDTQPNFIRDWINSESLARAMPFDTWRETGSDGLLRVPQQVLLSLNSMLIVAFVVPVSHLVRTMRSLTAMLGGMIVVTFGVLTAGTTQSAWVLLFGITMFSLGEMLVGPKKSEYLALIAPTGKKALYLGYVVIPTGIGRGVGNKISGWLYREVGEKANLSLRYLMEKTPFGQGKQWNGRTDSLEDAAGVTRTEAFTKLQEVTGLGANEATQLLWDTYHPQYWFWLPFVAVGVLAAIALYIFGRMARRWADMNA